jgi:large subunit ribosomal protein L10
VERAAKYQAVEALNGVFRTTSVAIVAHYSGLTVAQMQKLRVQMKQAGASVKVSKNRLAKIALEGTDVVAIGSLLKGPTLIATSNDPIAAPKVAIEFAKSNEMFVILGGAMGKTVLDVNGVKALASLPSLNELRAQIVGLLVAPATKLAQLANAPATKLARVIQMRPEMGINLASTDLASAVQNAHDKDPAPVAPPLHKEVAPGGTTVSSDLLSVQQPLPSTIVKSLGSSEAYKRTEGIRAASQFLLSVEERDKMPSTAVPLGPIEIFEASTLPTRLYERIFSSQEEEAREAAYALVVSTSQFRGQLDPNSSPLKLDEKQEIEFRAGLIKLLSDMKFGYFIDVDAKPQQLTGTSTLGVHVTVKVMRRLPFKIGSKDVFLDGPEILDDRLSISSPLADKVTATKQLETKESGLVASGEVDMIVRCDHLLGRRIPIVVYFNRTEGSVNVEVA